MSFLMTCLLALPLHAAAPVQPRAVVLVEPAGPNQLTGLIFVDGTKVVLNANSRSFLQTIAESRPRPGEVEELVLTSGKPEHAGALKTFTSGLHVRRVIAPSSPDPSGLDGVSSVELDPRGTMFRTPGFTATRLFRKADKDTLSFSIASRSDRLVFTTPRGFGKVLQGKTVDFVFVAGCVGSDATQDLFRTHARLKLVVERCPQASGDAELDVTFMQRSGMLEFRRALMVSLHLEGSVATLSAGDGFVTL